jgi:hypothetical protein
MNSKEIQEQVLDWAYEQNFTAPYGVVDSEGKNHKGTKYLSVTFGYARTLDAHVRIFNPYLMIYESSAREREVFVDSNNLMAFLKERFGGH